MFPVSLTISQTFNFTLKATKPRSPLHMPCLKGAKLQYASQNINLCSKKVAQIAIQHSAKLNKVVSTKQRPTSYAQIVINTLHFLCSFGCRNQLDGGKATAKNHRFLNNCSADLNLTRKGKRAKNVLLTAHAATTQPSKQAGRQRTDEQCIYIISAVALQITVRS